MKEVNKMKENERYRVVLERYDNLKSGNIPDYYVDSDFMRGRSPHSYVQTVKNYKCQGEIRRVCYKI